ncbi:hypothetical protein ACTD5D_40240 [Nocardia takedensis]|uniref:hypothetical protein n=1 Tax=Nocardia takedensis TaxID=259390 RepID=UPI003F758B66
MSDTTESPIPAADERAVLDRTRRLQRAYADGDEPAARAELAALVADHGLDVIVRVMRNRHECDQLGHEVDLLRLFGSRALYGSD